MRSSACDGIRAKKLKPNSANIAIGKPSAVAIRACATPDVTCVGATRPEPPMTLNACIIPVMVPSRPIRGAAVTTVSSTHKPRLSVFLDAAGFVSGARFDPPRGLTPISCNDVEEAAVHVHRR
jgi:hypothetical protein